MKYHITYTVNYFKGERDMPSHTVHGRTALLKYIHGLLEEPNATSFVITIVKEVEGPQ